MKKLLNTLYVTTPESYLSKDGMNVVISVKQEEIFRIPIVNIEGIVTFGYMGASPGLMKLCTDNGVSLTFLSPSGKFIGRVQGATRGNVLLRKAQYERSSDEDFSLKLSRLFIAGKIHNYHSVLCRYLRDYGKNVEVESSAQIMKRRKGNILNALSIEELMGYEGDAASEYFSVFSHLLLNQKNEFPFAGRNKRPPKDAVNAMLSFAYTLLANEVTAALETVGLDPYVGFMHAIRPGRASLALDVMEEMRAYLGDRFVLSLINRRQISPDDFKEQGDCGVIMTDSARKQFITAWQTRKKDIITHPYLNEKIPLGLLPYVQSLLLARYIRGDIDNYPVFIMP